MLFIDNIQRADTDMNKIRNSWYIVIESCWTKQFKASFSNSTDVRQKTY